MLHDRRFSIRYKVNLKGVGRIQNIDELPVHIVDVNRDGMKLRVPSNTDIKVDDNIRIQFVDSVEMFHSGFTDTHDVIVTCKVKRIVPVENGLELGVYCADDNFRKYYDDVDMNKYYDRVLCIRRCFV